MTIILTVDMKNKYRKYADGKFSRILQKNMLTKKTHCGILFLPRYAGLFLRA